MLAALLALGLAAAAASLPGVPLPFDVDQGGKWILGFDLPPEYAAAGVQPGWVLHAVDGLEVQSDPEAARRVVALGPARAIRLHFKVPVPEVAAPVVPARGARPEPAPPPEPVDTILVVPRSPLVVVEEIGILPHPDGFTPGAARWFDADLGQPGLVDAANAVWSFDATSGAVTRVDRTAPDGTSSIPEVWWALSDAAWAVLPLAGPLTVSDRAGATRALDQTARLAHFQDRSGDHLARVGETGLTIYSVTRPAGTPELPLCRPDVPETCLVAGRQVASTLMDRPGGRTEALRYLGLACGGGTYRACVEAVALMDAELSTRAVDCIGQDVNACHEIAASRVQRAKGKPTALDVGVLEFACAVDASGSLGERLRRLEAVGEGCMLLAAAFDQKQVPDRALLSLDQACVLGRAEACTSAAVRRKEAFALKTVRECEDPELPLPSSCVQLGRLLAEASIQATEHDEFSAFLRGCELGDEEGCVLLGDFIDRWGIEHVRVRQAEDTLLGSCGEGEQRACVGAAHLLVRHDPRSDAYGKALSLFSAACDAGVPSACIAGARQRRIGSARKLDAPTPEAMWGLACDQFSAPGCAGLGERFSRSKKTWPDAYTAWTKACDTGEASACTDLGLFVQARHDPPYAGEQSPEAYLQRGCEHGDAEGCYWQAADDLPKKGEPPEPAYLLLSRSCDGGFGEACAELGGVHTQRETSFDDEIAAGHLQRACDNGHFQSCKELSDMYQRGKGVEKDRAKARELAQRFSVNANRRHVRLGLRAGFPSLAGGEAELVAPIPVGPAFSVTGSYSYVPQAGGIMMQLKGQTYPAYPPNLVYADAGLRLYPNNKGRGLYGMAGAHYIQASGGELVTPLVRTGLSARLGMYNENRFFYTRLEMGIGQYGMIYLVDFDEDETSSFPLVQAVLAFSMGLAVL